MVNGFIKVRKLFSYMYTSYLLASLKHFQSWDQMLPSKYPLQPFAECLAYEQALISLMKHAEWLWDEREEKFISLSFWKGPETLTGMLLQPHYSAGCPTNHTSNTLLFETSPSPIPALCIYLDPLSPVSNSSTLPPPLSFSCTLTQKSLFSSNQSLPLYHLSHRYCFIHCLPYVQPDYKFTEFMIGKFSKSSRRTLKSWPFNTSI